MMNDTVWAVLNGLQPGKSKAHGAMNVLPLFDTAPRSLAYITLTQAMRAGAIRITEVSAGGSVPELDAENLGKDHVFLFDGEEVAGAKQNRVFNSSILIEAMTKIRIPVSCTERGRWSYRSPEFRPSGNVMAAKMRARKADYVRASLLMNESFAGNQGAVWNDIDELHETMESSSPTDAMSDVFESRRKDIDDFVRSFRPEPGQTGLVVTMDGRLLGFDYLSRPDAFAEVSQKLVRSYAVEALSGRRRMRDFRPPRQTDPLEHIRNLLLDAESSTESLHKSVGLGRDYRYRSRDLIGSGLLADGEVVHVSLLAADEIDDRSERGGAGRWLVVR